MVMPTIFSERGTPITASYDWYDFASGAGYKKFYACGAANSAGDLNFLTNEALDADYTNFDIAAAGDVDFDITFGNPVTIAAADAFISFTNYNNTADKTNTIVFTLYHVSAGAVETSLGSVTCTSTSTGAWYFRKTTKMALTSKIVNIGEKLRLNVTLTTTGGTAYVFIDPKSRFTFTESGSGKTINGDLTINIPFKPQI